MNDEETTPELAMARALKLVREEPATRSQALTVTKLEEAWMWFRQHRQDLLNKAREHMGKVDGNPS